MTRRFSAATVLVLILITAAVLGAWGVAPVAASSAAETVPAAFAVDSVHSCVLFRIRHNGIGNFYGRFNAFEGTMNFDAETKTFSDLAMTVKADSVDTANNGRDNHIKSADYFNTEAHPEMSFKATSPVTVSDGQVSKLTGELAFKGVTKEVTGDLEWIGAVEGRRGMRLGFEARVTFKRSDFGEANVGGVSDEVMLIVAVEGVPARSQ